jgi:protein Tex
LTNSELAQSPRGSNISENWKSVGKRSRRPFEEQGKLTPELKAKIEVVLDRSELEDLYLPYKPKRRTKAMIAREKGL